ncbi:MAG: ABC transporter ATP-binding protein [Acidobacteriota bacterium]|nr:ABC transporter ATP-binding protein [Acidobacteriota bacterium]
MSSEKAIEAKSLTKLFGSRRAVDGISFSVLRGETFGLLGPNGAGKSTTMRMIACRSPLSSGNLHIEGLDAKTEDRRIRRLIGVVPQENNLDPDLNVRENLRVYAGYFRLERLETEKRIDELLNFIRLGDRTSSRVDELSGGMKRRLMIARALLHHPRILLLDEPTTGLDPNVRQEIWEKLEELRREENLTILLSTHYMDEAEKLCQRLLVLSQGSIVAEGVPRELIEKEASRYVLEVREAATFSLQPSRNGIRSTTRGSTHLYFADTAEKLLPLMPFYQSRQMTVRPSNLEDVFLQLTENEEN